MASTVEIKVLTSKYIDYWDRFINANRFLVIHPLNPDIKYVRFNFENCHFMEPFHIVSLACLIEEYYSIGIVISIVNVNDGNLLNYLKDVNFIDYWASRPKSYIPSERNTALSLWKINPEMIDEYCRESKGYFERNYLDNKKDLQPLATSLAELFSNVFDHSRSGVDGFCLTQFYPNIGKLKFSVCDFGKGIPNSINLYLKEKDKPELSDTDCLIKAFELNFTTQSTPRNRGFGLDTIKSIVSTNRGSLKVVANRAILKLENSDVQTIAQTECFYGTHFEIVLGIENLSDKTAETVDFDIDF